MSAHDEPGGRRVRVLDVDPELGIRLSPDERRHAHAACRATLIEVPVGVWNLPERLKDPASIYALVVIDGMLCRETSLRLGSLTELLIAGDVFSPDLSADDAGDELIRPSVSLTALNSVQILVLTDAFLKAGGVWPGLMLAVRDRVAAQQAHLATQGLALHLSRSADRVLLTLWLLADRCGTVTTQGTVLAFQIPHTALSRLTGSRRPTVSLALSELRESGSLQTTQDGRIILTPQGQRHLAELTSTPADQVRTPFATSLKLPEPRFPMKSSRTNRHDRMYRSPLFTR